MTLYRIKVLAELDAPIKKQKLLVVDKTGGRRYNAGDYVVITDDPDDSGHYSYPLDLPNLYEVMHVSSWAECEGAWKTQTDDRHTTILRVRKVGS